MIEIDRIIRTARTTKSTRMIKDGETNKKDGSAAFR